MRSLAVGTLLFSSAFGQSGEVDKRFALSVQPAYGVSRGHAPVPLNVTLKWAAPQLIEGSLQLDWYVDTTRLGQYISPELALADSTVNVPVILPPIMLSHDQAIVSVQATFITEDVVYNLDVHDVALQPDWRRTLLVGICGPPRQLPGPLELELQLQQQDRHHPFDLEPYFEQRFTKRELLVDETDVPPEDVPDDPLKMTAFDLFVIRPESFPKLKPRQLASLLAWVRGGGSLCVHVDSMLPKTHALWLNQLAGTDVANAAYLHQPNGELVAAAHAEGGLHRHVLDLGRAVVAFGEPDIETDAWEQAVLFLWKVRADRRHAALVDQPWVLSPASFRGLFDQYIPLEPQRVLLQSDLARHLLPDSVRGLPLGTVALVLVLFLLVIAPGDYYVLGWLKRRRWTWVLFPAVSLLFTGGTMWLARQHLGETLYDQSITIVDLGRDGQPVRTSRFELLFAPSNRRTTSDQQQALMVPLDPVVVNYSQGFSPPQGPVEYEPSWHVTGRVPNDFTVHRDVQQWSPRTARVTSFGSPGMVDTEELSRVNSLLQSLMAESDRQRPLPAEAFRDVTPTAVFSLQGSRQDLLQQDARLPSFVLKLAESITRRNESKYFSIVSQLSPTAGGNAEDLSLLDPSDPRQSVIVAVTNIAEGQYLIYRRRDWEQE